MPNEQPKTEEIQTDQQPEKKIDDPTAAFQYGVDKDILILFTNKMKGPFEISAFVEGRGIVTITNKGTMGGELKMVEGNNKRLLPDDKSIYVTADIMMLLNLSEKQVHKRKFEEPKKFDPDATGVHKIQVATGEPVRKAVGGL